MLGHLFLPSAPWRQQLSSLSRFYLLLPRISFSSESRRFALLIYSIFAGKHALSSRSKEEANRRAELNQQRPNWSRMDCVAEKNAKLLEKQLSSSKRKVKRWQGRFPLTLFCPAPTLPSCVFHILYSWGSAASWMCRRELRVKTRRLCGKTPAHDWMKANSTQMKVLVEHLLVHLSVRHC